MGKWSIYWTVYHQMDIVLGFVSLQVTFSVKFSTFSLLYQNICTTVYFLCSIFFALHIITTVYIYIKLYIYMFIYTYTNIYIYIAAVCTHPGSRRSSNRLVIGWLKFAPELRKRKFLPRSPKRCARRWGCSVLNPLMVGKLMVNDY